MCISIFNNEMLCNGLCSGVIFVFVSCVCTMISYVFDQSVNMCCFFFLLSHSLLSNDGNIDAILAFDAYPKVLCLCQVVIGAVCCLVHQPLVLVALLCIIMICILDADWSNEKLFTDSVAHADEGKIFLKKNQR